MCNEKEREHDMENENNGRAIALGSGRDNADLAPKSNEFATMVVRNPAPDASPSREPTGIYRILTTSR